MFMRRALPAQAEPSGVSDALPSMWPAVGARGGQGRASRGALPSLPLARKEGIRQI